MMNPLCKESIQQSEALHVIKRLMYVGIEINEHLVKACKDSPEKTSALKYLERVKQKRNTYLYMCQNSLETEVTKDQIQIFTPIFRSYDLRMTIAGDKKLEEIALAAQ